MYERASAETASSLLTFLLKYGALIYHAIFPHRSGPPRITYPTPSSSSPKIGEPSSSKRLYVPNLLENWPWLDARNPAFSDALNIEELAYFLTLPEVQQSKGLQAIVKKGFVRT